MNKRIKELMPKPWTFPYPDREMYSKEQMEEFARLIAKECAVLAMTEHHSTSPDDYHDMEPYEQGCDDTASAISGKIRLTFGVDNVQVVRYTIETAQAQQQQKDTE